LLFGFFDLDFETPSLWGLELVLLFLIPDLLVACFDFTVEVRDGAIVCGCSGEKLEADKRYQEILEGASGR
jgi:hypothetical protein